MRLFRTLTAARLDGFITVMDDNISPPDLRGSGYSLVIRSISFYWHEEVLAEVRLWEVSPRDGAHTATLRASIGVTRC